MGIVYQKWGGENSQSQSREPGKQAATGYKCQAGCQVLKMSLCNRKGAAQRFTMAGGVLQAINHLSQGCCNSKWLLNDQA